MFVVPIILGLFVVGIITIVPIYAIENNDCTRIKCVLDKILFVIHSLDTHMETQIQLDREILEALTISHNLQIELMISSTDVWYPEYNERYIQINNNTHYKDTPNEKIMCMYYDLLIHDFHYTECF